MEEKQIIYQIFNDMWKLSKKYINEKMDEQKWNAMTDEANQLSNKYRDCDETVWHLFRSIYTALEHYVEVKSNA